MLQVRSFVVLLLSAVWLFSAVGCVSTEDRLNRAGDARDRGDFAAAANEFLRVLSDERDNAEARSGLERTGPQAVASLWAEAQRDDAAGSYLSALSGLSSLENMITKAAGFGITLSSPGDIAGFQSRLQTSAIDQSITEAKALMSAGQPDRAASEMVALQSRFDLGARLPEVAKIQAEAELASAAGLMRSGKPRAAWERAGMAIATLGSVPSPVRQNAEALREEALREGTRHLAIVPFWRTETFSQMASELLRSDLNYAIENAEEPPLPLWIEQVDAEVMERLLRRDRADRKILLRQELRSLGRELGVDVIVAGELIRLDQAEEVISERRVPIRTTGRSGVDTVFVQQEMRMAIGLRAAYRVIDVNTGAIMEEGEVPAAGVSEFRRGVYAGDWRTLDLSGNQLRLFNLEQVYEGIVEAERGLARTLATEIRLKAFAAAMSTVE